MKLKSKTKKWNKNIEEHFNKELLKLQRMNIQAAEYSIQRNYLDLILDLPWNEYSKDNFSLQNALKILNRDHYGLIDVKKRIIEQIAVMKLRGDMNSPILCFYGPQVLVKLHLENPLQSLWEGNMLEFHLVV